ncbi:hypothetical protein ACP4OV_019391 [Aristida adscensionis]
MDKINVPDLTIDGFIKLDGCDEMFHPLPSARTHRSPRPLGPRDAIARRPAPLRPSPSSSSAPVPSAAAAKAVPSAAAKAIPRPAPPRPGPGQHRRAQGPAVAAAPRPLASDPSRRQRTTQHRATPRPPRHQPDVAPPWLLPSTSRGRRGPTQRRRDAGLDCRRHRPPQRQGPLRDAGKFMPVRRFLWVEVQVDARTELPATRVGGRSLLAAFSSREEAVALSFCK